MKTRIFTTLTTTMFLLALSLTALAQEATQKRKPETIATVSKLVISKVKVGEGDAYEIRGKAVFNITAANSDDTVTGNIVYTVPEDARQKIAQMTGKQAAQVPATVTVKDVNAGFQKGTKCPVITLEFNPMQMDIAGIKANFTRFGLDINETNRDMEKYFCTWTKQINNGMSRRGPIAKINMLLTGETDEPQ